MLFVAMFVAASDVTGFMFFGASRRKFFGFCRRICRDDGAARLRAV
jgi:hypothetical protein